MIFYNRPDKFKWTFYKSPNKKFYSSTFWACLGFILAIEALIFSFVAIIEWIFIININGEYKIPYAISIPYIARFDGFLFSILFTIILYYYWFYKEYKLNKKMLEENIEV